MIQHRCCTPHCGFTAQKRTERLLVLNATFAFTRWQRDSPELTTGREKKKRREARSGKARRDETRHDEARQGKARQGEARWKKVNGATSGTREKNIQPTRVPARRRLNTTPVARYEWEVCLACATEWDRAILSRRRRDEESVRETKNSFHRVRSRQAKGWATDRRKP